MDTDNKNSGMRFEPGELFNEDQAARLVGMATELLLSLSEKGIIESSYQEEEEDGKEVAVFDAASLMALHVNRTLERHEYLNALECAIANDGLEDPLNTTFLTSRRPFQN